MGFCSLGAGLNLTIPTVFCGFLQMQTKTSSLLQCEVVLVHVKASCRSISMPHALFSKNPFSLKLHLCVDKVVALFWANGFKILRIFRKEKIPGTPKPGRYWPPVKGFLKKLSLLGYDLSFWRCNITAPQLNCQILGDISMNRMVMNGWLGITIRIVKNRDPGTMTSSWDTNHCQGPGYFETSSMCPGIEP